MPNAAIVAAALTDHSAHPYSLFLDGLDIIGSAINPLGVPIETIDVDEAGPGGVSSISFVLEDPTLVASVANGSVIRFHWNTPDIPLFLGWVDTFSYQPAFGGQGKSISIQGIGIEALLDWLIVPDTTLSQTYAPDQVQDYATRTNNPMLNAISSGQVTPALSTLAKPVSGYWRAVGDVAPADHYAQPTAGQSLRQTIQALIDSAIVYDAEFGVTSTNQIRVIFTVGFYGELRLWNDYPTAIPSEYTNLTINDVYAGPIVADSLSYTVDPSQIVHEVYVNGSAAANSGWFADGTGIKGLQAYVSDTTNITSPAKAYQAAQNVLQSASNQVRGSFDLLDFTPVATIHVGSYVTITDTAVGQSAQSYRIMEIEKTFTGAGRQNWTVNFGSLKPSVTRYTRQLTRSVRS